MMDLLQRLGNKRSNGMVQWHWLLARAFYSPWAFILAVVVLASGASVGLSAILEATFQGCGLE